MIKRTELIQLRKQQGWTQSDLAKKLGVTRSTVNSLENGRLKPSLKVSTRLEFVFDKDVEEIFPFL
jgi:putative transcriptional regulator